MPGDRAQLKRASLSQVGDPTDVFLVHLVARNCVNPHKIFTSIFLFLYHYPHQLGCTARLEARLRPRTRDVVGFCGTLCCLCPAPVEGGCPRPALRNRSGWCLCCFGTASMPLGLVPMCGSCLRLGGPAGDDGSSGAFACTGLSLWCPGFACCCSRRACTGTCGFSGCRHAR